MTPIATRSGSDFTRFRPVLANRAKTRSNSQPDALFDTVTKQLGNQAPPKLRGGLRPAKPQLEEVIPKVPEIAAYLIDCARTGKPDPERFGISEEHAMVYKVADAKIAACTGVSFIDPSSGNANFPRLYAVSKDAWMLTSMVRKRPAKMHALLKNYLQLKDNQDPKRLLLDHEAATALKTLLRDSKTGLTLETIFDDTLKLKLKARDAQGRNASALLAWILSLCAVMMHGRAQIDSSPTWQTRALF